MHQFGLQGWTPGRGDERNIDGSPLDPDACSYPILPENECLKRARSPGPIENPNGWPKENNNQEAGLGNQGINRAEMKTMIQQKKIDNRLFITSKVFFLSNLNKNFCFLVSLKKAFGLFALVWSSGANSGQRR